MILVCLIGLALEAISHFPELFQARNPLALSATEGGVSKGAGLRRCYRYV